MRVYAYAETRTCCRGINSGLLIVMTVNCFCLVLVGDNLLLAPVFFLSFHEDDNDEDYLQLFD